MSSEVAIAETEPRLAVEALERREHVERFAVEAPALRAIHRARERVGDGVDIGRDVQPVKAFVVAGVDDDGQPREIDTPTRPSSRAFSSNTSTGTTSPESPPACAVMLSSISVPDRSLHPALSVSAARSMPHFTHEVWILSICPRRNSRDVAYIWKSSFPRSTGDTRPLRYSIVFW